MSTKPIDSIKIGDRFRKDLGDIKSLTKSIQEIGLLHPVVVTPKGELIAGRRRLEACKLLKWQEIPAHIVDIESIMRGEYDENIHRKGFTPSEAVAIWRAMESYQGQQLGSDSEPSERPKRIKRAAKAVGMGVDKLSKAKQVIEAAEKEPRKYEPLLEKMDRTGNVDVTYRELKKEKKAEEISKLLQSMPPVPDWAGAFKVDTVSLANIEELHNKLPPDSIDLIFTDPPYDEESLPLYAKLGELAKGVLKPGAYCIVYCGKMYLPQAVNHLCKHLEYVWIFSVFHPFSKSKLHGDLSIFENWRPIAIFKKAGKAKSHQWVQDVVRGVRDKAYHEWQQDEAAALQYIEAYSNPEDIVLDPFVGGGTTPVACKKLARHYICFDKEADSVKQTLRRLHNDTGRPEEEASMERVLSRQARDSIA